MQEAKAKRPSITCPGETGAKVAPNARAVRVVRKAVRIARVVRKAVRTARAVRVVRKAVRIARVVRTDAPVVRRAVRIARVARAVREAARIVRAVRINPAAVRVVLAAPAVRKDVRNVPAAPANALSSRHGQSRPGLRGGLRAAAEARTATHSVAVCGCTFRADFVARYPSAPPPRLLRNAECGCAFRDDFVARYPSATPPQCTALLTAVAHSETTTSLGTRAQPHRNA